MDQRLKVEGKRGDYKARFKDNKVANFVRISWANINLTHFFVCSDTVVHKIPSNKKIVQNQEH